MREALVDLLEADGIDDPAVLRALGAVPREEFVPARARSLAYENHPLSIGHEQTISQPWIVAFMTQALGLDPDSRVLEVGTGSGYQAAILAEITPSVWTIEIVEELGQRAQRTLSRLGYDSVQCRIGDGFHGWPEEAPFDAIIVTAAPEILPAPLVEQLAIGGRLCIPIGNEGNQELRRYTRNNDGSLEEERLVSVRFVPMTGAIERQPVEERK